MAPVTPARAPTAALLTQLGERSQVPIWLPAPLPTGWLASGVSWAGEEPDGVVASVTAVSGPDPIPEVDETGPGGDLILVSEQPGVGLGAHLAGLPAVDPGLMLAEKVQHGRAEAHLDAAGHEVPMWSIPVPDGIGFVGEAAGVWLWLLAWPATSAALLLDGFALIDARVPEQLFDVPMGALSPRLERGLR